jgi:hypothetical protein
VFKDPGHQFPAGAAPKLQTHKVRGACRSGGNKVIRCPRFSIVLILALVSSLLVFVRAAGAQRDSHSPQLAAPIAVYSHDSNYGLLPVASPIDEKQAMRDLDEILRLKNAGVRFDYDLIDASGFAPQSAYRVLRAAEWPNGPDAWIARCRAAGVRPGLRIDGNILPSTQGSSGEPPPQWKDSLDQDGRNLSLFEGGFLPDFMSAMQSWYDRGVRLFQFDSIDLSAATPAAAAKLSQPEIASRNAAALRHALQAFRSKNGEALLVVSVEPVLHRHLPAQSETDSGTRDPNSQTRTGPAQLGAFTLVSTGVPRPASTPQANLWRSIDIQSDATVRRLEQSGLPLAQIDSDGFTANSVEDSGMRAWKGAFLLSLARGGWVNSIHGGLALIQDDDVRWIARAQRLFFYLQQQGHVHSFGGTVGLGQPYGFAGANSRGSVYVVVNPGDTAATLSLPLPASDRPGESSGRVQFRDAGFVPHLEGNTITLGPGQMAMVGFGVYAASAYNLGVQQDVIIPHSVEQVAADFHSTSPGALEASFDPPINGVVRLIVRPRISAGKALSTFDSGDTAEDPSLAFTLDATQYGRPIPVRFDNAKNAGGALSWVVGEIDVNDLTPGVPLVVRFHSNDNDLASLEANAYAVVY